MKLQGLSIVFVLIVIPMILVLTYYVQLQVETIELQTSYDAKLLDATHDAMVAFELNTANEDLSSVADSLRTIIDASSNIFLNTLATNMGLSNASKSYLEPYIPAVLYTLYDGYYINSPTKIPEIAVDENEVAIEITSKPDEPNKFSIPGLNYTGVDYVYKKGDTEYYSITGVPAEDFGELLYKKEDPRNTKEIYYCTTNVNDDNISYSTEYVLKSYMPYSARYVVGSGGSKKDVVINYTLDNYLTIIYNYKDRNYTKSGYLIKSGLVNKAVIETTGVNLLDYNENDAETKIIEALKSGQKVKIELIAEDGSNLTIDTTDINSDEATSIIYYTKAAIFSNWVYKNLSDLEEGHIVENMSDVIVGTTQKGFEDIVYTFDGKTNKVFDISQDPEKNNSNFLNHKYQVIKNSIQYNLNLAMSIYNDRTTEDYDFNMPVISEDKWERIIENISIVSFMQGLNCGLKTYNNYAIVSSTNNEVTIIPEEIYYVKVDEFNNGSSSYHRIDCPKLKEELDAASNKKLTSFVSKEVKYDKIYDKNKTPPYLYDHKNLACYTCIVDGNYVPETLDDIRKYAYYVSIGKERQNIYKMNAIKYSEGYEVQYDLDALVNIKLNEVKQFKVTFGHIPVEDFNETTVAIRFWGIPGSSDLEFVLTTNQVKEQTVTIPIDVNVNTNWDLALITLVEKVSSSSKVKEEDIQNAMKSLKIIYK